MKRIINCETGKITERDLNKDEIAQMQIDAEKVLIAKNDQQERELAKKFILDKLGITADEAALLIQ